MDVKHYRIILSSVLKLVTSCILTRVKNLSPRAFYWWYPLRKCTKFAKYTSYIMQMMRTTNFVYFCSHGKKVKFWILKGPSSPFNNCEIILHKFRHNTFIPGRFRVWLCSVD